MGNAFLSDGTTGNNGQVYITYDWDRYVRPGGVASSLDGFGTVRSRSVFHGWVGSYHGAAMRYRGSRVF